MRGNRFFRMRVKLAGVRVSLNGSVELGRLECLEPLAKASKLTGGELFNGFLDFLDGGHAGGIALRSER